MGTGSLTTLRTALLGPSGKVLVGGTGSSSTDVPPCPEFAEGEPVSWHSPHPKVYEELLYSFQVRKVLDGSCLDESFPAACIIHKCVYVGMVWTQRHKELLEAKLAKFVPSIVFCTLYVFKTNLYFA